MLTRITLENWKSHKESVFEFDKGTNLLVGSLGSGKSSVMDAICFALFGSYPAVNSKKITLSKTVMRKPTQMDFSKVKLDFSYNDKNYSVERIINLEKSSEAKIYCNNTFIIGPKPKDVNKKIADILSVSYNLFTRAVYSEQNQLDFFLKLSPRERKEKLDELLELEKYEKVRSNVNSVNNRLKKNLIDRKKVLASERGSINLEELKKLENSLIEKNKKVKKLNENFEKTLNESKELEIVVTNLSEKSKKFNKLKEVNLNLKAKAALFLEDIKKIEEKTKMNLSSVNVESLKTEKENLVKKQEEYSKKNEEIIKLNEKLKGIESNFELNEKYLNEREKKVPENFNSSELIVKENEKVNQKIKLLTKNILDFEKKIEENQKKNSDVKGLINSYKNKSKEAGKVISLLDCDDANCPLCKKELTQIQKDELNDLHKKEVLDITKKLENLEEELVLLDKMKLEFKNQKKKTENELNESKDILNSLKEFEKVLQEITEFKKRKNEFSIEKKGILEKIELERKNLLEFDLDKLKIEIEKIILVLNGLEKYSELVKLKELLNKTNSEINELNFNEKELDSKKELYVKSKSGIDSIKSELGSTKEIIKNITSSINSINKLKNHLEKLKEQIEHEEKMVEQLNIFSNSLVSTQNQLRQAMIENLNLAMHDIWKYVYPYGDFVSAKIDVIDGNYEVLVCEKNGTWVKAEGSLSGGERSAVALTLRVSISLVLVPNLSWLILDEPTHNLDSKAVRELSIMLREHLPKLVDQIFIITHDKELEEAASAKTYNLERNKEIEGITKPIAKF